MQNRFVRQGFSSFFFQTLSHCLVADAVDYLQLYELVCQQIQGPPLPTSGRLAACQLHQACLPLAVELLVSRWPRPWVQRCFDPLERTAFTHTLDRADSHIQVLHDLFVLQTLVRFEQNPRVDNLLCRVSTGCCKSDQSLSLFFREIDVIEFHLYLLHDYCYLGKVFGVLLPINGALKEH